MFLAGFIRGSNAIAESAVQIWLPDEFYVGLDSSGKSPLDTNRVDTNKRDFRKARQNL